MFPTSSIVFDIFAISAVVIANLLGVLMIYNFISTKISSVLFERDEKQVNRLVRKMKEEGFDR